MYEYKVIPAPAKGKKKRGLKGAEARFAHALETAMNELAADGWEFQRADILPSEERQGLTSTQTVYRSVLVFRRLTEADAIEALVEAQKDEADLSEDHDDELEDDMSQDEMHSVEDAVETEEPEAEKV
ncbi:DUF4177 domain-containing protein [Roseovarius phycicola]|uniref:DUF4177 domain-containing protein n=1 Tax=Roseovarius phycicola TaxID=3080976 RepID=A0ABZ2HIT7_9RHOB